MKLPSGKCHSTYIASRCKAKCWPQFLTPYCVTCPLCVKYESCYHTWVFRGAFDLIVYTLYKIAICAFHEPIIVDNMWLRTVVCRNKHSLNLLNDVWIIPVQFVLGEISRRGTVIGRFILLVSLLPCSQCRIIAGRQQIWLPAKKLSF